jgi:hypothetical protein
MKRPQLCPFFRFLFPVVLLLTFALGGCGSKSPCQDNCSKDDDCESGLSCVSMQGKGRICVPSGCATCTSSAPTCSYEVTTYTNGDISCSFLSCQ